MGLPQILLQKESSLHDMQKNKITLKIYFFRGFFAVFVTVFFFVSFSGLARFLCPSVIGLSSFFSSFLSSVVRFTLSFFKAARNARSTWTYFGGSVTSFSSSCNCTALFKTSLGSSSKRSIPYGSTLPSILLSSPLLPTSHVLPLLTLEQMESMPPKVLPSSHHQPLLWTE